VLSALLRDVAKGEREMTETTTALSAAGRAVLVYVIVALLLRLNRRQLQLHSSFNFVANVTVGALAGSAILNLTPLWPTVAGLAALVLVNWLVSFASYRCPRFERAVKGERAVLVRDGEVDEREARRYLLTPADLVEAAQRSCGVRSLRDVERLIFEPSGLMTVVPDVTCRAARR
jgi:uncharacterized membrane protein YcaP (DUF421 family)